MNAIIIDDDELSRRVIEEYIDRTDSLTLVGSFENGVDAINAFKSGKIIDLVFLDIEMPEMSGIEFLNTLTYQPQIIIFSSKERYALEAFEYDVTDYLLKPVHYHRFYKAVAKALKRFQKEGTSTSDKNEMFIKKNNSLVKVRYDDILWIEALENYVTLNTFDEKFTIHFTMKAIEGKLPVAKFYRVHRSYIVNRNSVNVIEDGSIVIPIDKGEKKIPIGKSYRDKLMDDLNLMVK